MTATAAVALAATFGLLGACDSGQSRPQQFAGASEHHRARLTVDDVRTGAVRATVAITGTDGRPSDVDTVGLETAMPRMGHQNAKVSTNRTGPGTFQANGELFAMPGVWEVSVRITDNHRTETVTVPVTVIT